MEMAEGGPSCPHSPQPIFPHSPSIPPLRSRGMEMGQVDSWARQISSRQRTRVEGRKGRARLCGQTLALLCLYI
jgi:hypothetical protein